MKSKRTPIPARLLRLVRLIFHLALGLTTAWLRFPRISERQQLEEKRLWSEALLSILAISVRDPQPTRALPDRCMLVLNHISWLDIFVIDARFPATFIAKSEIRSWPLVGWLCTLVGTLYIERGRRSAARLAREAVAAELERGVVIAVFPEGTTTFGDSLGRFHAALFQPALDARATVQPVALRYLDEDGTRTDAAGYVGDTSLLESIWTIVSTRRMEVEFNLLEPVRTESAQGTRRRLADQAEAAIASALRVPLPARSAT